MKRVYRPTRLSSLPYSLPESSYNLDHLFLHFPEDVLGRRLSPDYIDKPSASASAHSVHAVKRCHWRYYLYERALRDIRVL